MVFAYIEETIPFQAVRLMYLEVETDVFIMVDVIIGVSYLNW